MPSVAEKLFDNTVNRVENSVKQDLFLVTSSKPLDIAMPEILGCIK